MNHTERIIQVSRQVRGLTREHARQAVELYLESVANELAQGDLVTLPSVGRLHVVIRKNGGRIIADITAKQPQMRAPGNRVQGCWRLSEELKAQCRQSLDMAKSGLTRIEAGEPIHDRVQPGLNPVSSNKKER